MVSMQDVSPSELLVLNRADTTDGRGAEYPLWEVAVSIFVHVAAERQDGILSHYEERAEEVVLEKLYGS